MQCRAPSPRKWSSPACQTHGAASGPATSPLSPWLSEAAQSPLTIPSIHIHQSGVCTTCSDFSKTYSMYCCTTCLLCCFARFSKCASKNGKRNSYRCSISVKEVRCLLGFMSHVLLLSMTSHHIQYRKKPKGKS